MRLSFGHTPLLSYCLVRAYGLLGRALGPSFRPGGKGFDWPYFLYKALYEDKMRDHLRRYPLGSGHCLDIGAHIGYTSRVLLKHLKPGYSVFGLEPERANFLALQRLGRRNRAFQAHPFAVGQTSGQALLQINERHPGDHHIVSAPSSSTQWVRMVSVDDFLKDQRVSPRSVVLVKVDVQGFEGEVFQGMQGLLNVNPGVRLVFEWDPSLGANGPPQSHLQPLLDAGQRLVPLGHHLYATIPSPPI